MRATVEERNARILLLAAVGAIPFGWRAVAGVSLGGGIQVVNLRALERSVAGLLGRARRGGTRGVRALLMLRQMVLLAVVATVLISVPVHSLAFVVGLSTVVPAVIWHGLAARREG